ncbi:hypothetical protein, partial [Escherichia coli]|uniref:hypothetical protein n=1 Tax=Escherichia coli TaxID=562 RepID=UPI0005C54DCE
MTRTITTEDSDAPWPLEDVAANVERAFAEAGAHPVEPTVPVPAETVRLMDEAFGQAEAIALSPN